jgi:hypothetical protein
MATFEEHEQSLREGVGSVPKSSEADKLIRQYLKLIKQCEEEFNEFEGDPDEYVEEWTSSFVNLGLTETFAHNLIVDTIMEVYG